LSMSLFSWASRSSSGLVALMMSRSVISCLMSSGSSRQLFLILPFGMKYLSESMISFVSVLFAVCTSDTSVVSTSALSM
jgi:hypothetical protein